MVQLHKAVRGLILVFVLLLSIGLTVADAADPKAKRIRTDTTNFDNNLSPADDNVQKALDTLDDTAGGGGGDMLKSTYDIDEDGIVDDAEVDVNDVCGQGATTTHAPTLDSDGDETTTIGGHLQVNNDINLASTKKLYIDDDKNSYHYYDSENDWIRYYLNGVEVMRFE